ncbi:MAG TPA: toll/interleukin-1 receptor domain-containing protein [Solirubrobacterales bacterium]|nr:toll/interleukin-1 receptor domain-containing protein [Solirubrobacterales bacterium]
MKLFLSHANADLYLAQTLRLALDELSSEMDCFLFADDVFAGDDWEERIRTAAGECDAIVNLATEQYVSRPWFIAEWAAFWLQEKTWYPLLYKVMPGELFAPILRRQAFSLTDRHETKKFLASLPVTASIDRPLDLVSADLVKALEQADAMHAEAAAAETLERLAESLNGEQSEIEPTAVEALCKAGRMQQILELVRKSENSVALRRLGAVLVRLRELSAARTVADRTPNLAERRTIGVRGLDLLKEKPDDREAEDLCIHIYRSVRDPQRRDLRNAASERGLDVKWPELEPNP